MIPLMINDETAPLEAVVVGRAESFGGTPSLKDTYDPKSKAHIKAGTYPLEPQLVQENQQLLDVFRKYEVEVYRPAPIDHYNQIFSRDIGMVIGDRFLVPQIVKNREEEIQGLEPILAQIPEEKILKAEGEIRIEGGDIMPWKGNIFAGYSRKEDFERYVVSRTNEAGIEFLTSSFPNWEVHAFELQKSDEDPYQNALHLDCCFQPIGNDQAILFPGGFKNPSDVDFLREYFGADKIIEISREEMYHMYSNVFSISPEVIISEKGFSRLNQILKDRGFLVEEVTYAETAKMEGLFRCSTLPLRRKYE
jgi:N-dimethylarginine dimethylaminohydrolase